MPTPTQKNTENIISLGSKFDDFRLSTARSLRLIKFIGVPLLLFVIATGVKLLGDVGRAEGRIEVQSGRLDRIERSFERLTDAVLNNMAIEDR